MVQSFMIMTLIVLIPVITILSGFSIKAVVTLSFVYFALITTTFLVGIGTMVRLIYD